MSFDTYVQYAAHEECRNLQFLCLCIYSVLYIHQVHVYYVHAVYVQMLFIACTHCDGPLKCLFTSMYGVCMCVHVVLWLVRLTIYV